MITPSDTQSTAETSQSLQGVNNSLKLFICGIVLFSVIVCTYLILTKAIKKYYLIRGIDMEISWSNERTYCGRTVSCTVTCTRENLRTEDLEDIINNAVVYVEKIGQRVEISVVIEANDAHANSFTATFTVRKAGEYNIYVNYSCFFWEYSFNRSPFVKEFFSAEIDPAKTKLDIHNPNFICVQTGIVHQIAIDAKDFFGNLCNNNDLKLSQFQFVVKDMQSTADSSESEEKIEGKFIFIENGTKPSLHLKALVDSVIQASVLYGGKPIQNGSEFYIISLSSSEELQVEKNLMSFSSILKYFFTWDHIQFQGILMAIGTEMKNIEESPCRIRITITHRYIYVEEDFGFVYWRKASYNITKKTEVTFRESVNVQAEVMYAVVLSDGIQTPITVLLFPGEARIFLVTFAHFQGDQLRNFTTFQEKRACFYKNLCGTSLYWRHSTRHIRLYRSNLVQSMMDQVEDFSYHDWCAFFSVTFEEETTKGPLRNLSTDHEWLDLLCDEIFTNDPNGMFSYLGSTNLLHVNLAKSRNPKWQEKHYEFAGKILGKCLYESAVAGSSSLHVRFTRSLLSQLVGLPVNYQHLVQDHPEECDKVREILNSSDISKMGLTFTIEAENKTNPQGILEWIGASSTKNKSRIKINVIPDGSNVKVTNENKIFYLNAIAHYELAYKFTDEIAALRKGFCLLVSRELLADISEHDLDLLLCGGKVFNVKDLKKHHKLASCHVTSERRDTILSWFWSSLTNMNEEERLRLLQLVTGSCVLPAGGFKKLYPQFTIGIKGSFGQKPIGIPGLHEISLADHANFEKFETNLLAVVHGDWRQM